MNDIDRTEVWGTSDTDATAALPQARPEAEASSYGAMMDYPPYSTEQGPMRVDVPGEQSAWRPAPVPSSGGDNAWTKRNSSTDPEGRHEKITCPECGAQQSVNLNRRDAEDFCVRCDFPLFWTVSRIERDRNTAADDSLRRLPGTGGSNRLASASCPHCSELNTVMAETCQRCGSPMRVIAPPPPPAPEPYMPPPPLPAPAPKRDIAWMVWLAAGSLAVVAVLVTLFLAEVIRF